jgi:3-deoxy-D-manno-octulosonic acid kinase
MLDIHSHNIAIERDNTRYILYDASMNSGIHSVIGTGSPIRKLFDPLFLKTQQLADKVARGRGETIFFRIDKTQFVLRHYHRGGLAAQVCSDRYLWLGLKQTRAYREFAMLLSLSASNLSAPRPFAAHVIHHGCYYQADIITHAIVDTETLSERLQYSVIDDIVWKDIGETIATFHRKGVYHADLNANNIMLNSNNDVSMIDFDKAGFKDPNNASWRQRNLQRLERSLTKLSENNTIFYFNDKNWAQLEQGYYSAWNAAGSASNKIL